MTAIKAGKLFRRRQTIAAFVSILLLILPALLLGCGSKDSEETTREPALQPDLPALQHSTPAATSPVDPFKTPEPVEETVSESGYPSPSSENSVYQPLTLNGQPTIATQEQGAYPGPEPGDPGAAETTSPLEPTPNYPVYSGVPIDRDKIGIQIHLHREDLDWLMDHLAELRVGWVKVQVSWKIYQPEPARLDEARFGELDKLIAAANEAGIKVLLGVAKAPEWSRPTTELDGPPADYSRFESFMSLFAARYQGQVDAYELWNEPNLQREWNGYPLSAVDFVSLVEAGARGVRASDPEALIISGAPAATGVNDGQSAIDDRIYLQAMLDAGIAQVVEAIGAHPYGWANPPDSSSADPTHAAPSHNDHPSFFFLDTLNDYRAILDRSGNGHLPIWATEFGWGSFDSFGTPPPEPVAFMAYVDEQQQAEYTLGAFELSSQMAGLGPLFLWNLNFAPRLGPDYAESGYSLLRPDGTPRPAYRAMVTIPEVNQSP